MLTRLIVFFRHFPLVFWIKIFVSVNASSNCIYYIDNTSEQNQQFVGSVLKYFVGFWNVFLSALWGPSATSPWLFSKPEVLFCFKVQSREFSCHAFVGSLIGLFIKRKFVEVIRKSVCYSFGRQARMHLHSSYQGWTLFGTGLSVMSLW